MERIVQQISQMTLLEVAELNECLKKRLNIADTPMMVAGPAAAAPAPVEVSLIRNTGGGRKNYAMPRNSKIGSAY